MRRIALRPQQPRHRKPRWLAVVCTAYLLSACKPSAPAFNATELRPGGEGSVHYKPFAAFHLPHSNLPDAQKSDFYAGKALAEQPWVKAPTTTTARDGLGPLYNARTCLTCHVNGGRGHLTSDGIELLHGIVRISQPGESAHDTPAGVNAHPIYGDQLQTQSTALAHQLRHLTHEKFSEEDVTPEARITLIWETSEYTYPDGTRTTLQRPRPRLENLGYDNITNDLRVSLRNAPAIHGMGLLEAISQHAIDAQADPLDSNADGISGRINLAWNPRSQRLEPGRFGLKANRPTLEAAIAAAFANDVGITNPLFREQPCTTHQAECLAQITGNDASGVELPEHLLAAVVHFNRNIGVPKSRYTRAHVSGRTAFYKSGCANCHTPNFVTASDAPPHLADQSIWPYSDLLLHDMGEALADNRSDFAANGREWRTAPLWGIGLQRDVNGSRHLLHDGRAATVEAAILWHAGEALSARNQFTTLPNTERQQLIRFVESL